MKAKKFLALLLALCMVVSMIPIATMSVTAASATLDEGRITYYDQLYDYVDVNNSSSTIGKVANLFDKTFDKMEGGWGGSCTVIIKMTEAVKVTAYTMATNDDGSWNNRAPVDWTIYGSNDGETYTEIDKVENHPVLNVTNVYWEDDLRIANPGEYLYYKFEITKCAGSYFQIGELVLSGYDLTALEAVESSIDALPETIAESDVDTVKSVREAYDALGAVKASVRNTAKLLSAEGQVLVLGAEDKEKATAAINAISAIGTVTYKSEKAILAAEEAWAALSENDKAYLAGYGETLTNSRTAYDTLINNFSITINLGSTGRNAKVPTKWVPNMTADELAATARALEDEYKLWYTNGVNLGITPGKTYDKPLGSWMDVSYRLEMNDSPNDNVAFPMHDRTPTSFVTVPFAGMAFAMDPYVAETWDFNVAIGEPFQYQGKTWQVYTTGMKFYDTKEYANANGDGRSDSNTTITRWGFRPGSTTDETVKAAIGDGWSFIYAYAKYSMEHKWEGVTAGVPDGNVAAAASKTYYQKFYGPDGDTYILTNTDMMKNALAVTIDDETTCATFQAALEGSAYVVDGALAAVISNTNDFFAKAGDLVSVSATEVVFENGTVTADGFTESDSAATARVQAIIDALPDAGNVQAFHKAQIEAARASFNEVSETVQAAVNSAKLVAAEEAIKNIYDNDPAEAIALVNYIHDNLETVTYKSLAAINYAEETYDAMSAEVQARVTNFTRVSDARVEHQALVDAFEYTVREERPGVNDKITKNGWVATCSDDVWKATRDAILDATRYQYSKGRLIDGNGITDWDTWMTDNYGFWHVKNEQSDDNYNKQDFRNRYTTLVAPFPGMAFSVDTTFAQNWTFESALAVGEYFKMNGKTYQVMWDYYRSYDSVEPSNSADVPATDKVDNYPNEAANDTDTNKNIFRYAYAKYSQDHRWEGLTLGLPQSQRAISSGNTRYQEYVGPQGNAYLFTTTAMINAAPDVSAADKDDYCTKMDASYYLITGDLAEAFAAADPAERAGIGDLISVSDDEIVFQYGKLTAEGLTVERADYTAVEQAIAAIPADIDDDVYTTASVQAVKDAQNAVVYGLMKIDQETVDGFAAAINEAVANLVNRAVEMEIGIDAGMVTASSTMEGRYDITWNAKILIGESTSIGDINASGIKFKNYGVYYGTGADVLNDYKNASADEIRQVVFAEGESVDVYTSFGFRLKNVVENRVRAAMFYLEYEFDGKTFIILSTVDEVVAVVAA